MTFHTQLLISPQITNSVCSAGFALKISGMDNNNVLPAYTSKFISGTEGIAATLSDVQLPSTLHGSCIADALDNYAQANDIDTTDLVCWTVYQYQDAGINLSALPLHCRHSSIVGFVYENKAQIREEFGVKRISSCLKKVLDDRIEERLIKLSDLANNKSYSISLVHNSETISVIDDVHIDEFDNVALELIEDHIDAIA